MPRHHASSLSTPSPAAPTQRGAWSFALGAMAVLIAACGSGSGGTGPAPAEAEDAGADAGTLLAAPGALALRIDRARRAKLGGELQPVELLVTLANGEGGKPVSLSALLFRLRTVDGRLKLPTLSSSDAETDQLAGGASFQRRLTFDLGDALPVELQFAPPSAEGIGDARTASAPVVLELCATCTADCTYLDEDPNNCGSCGARITDTGSGKSPVPPKCVNGKVVCPVASQTACQGEPSSGMRDVACVDLATSQAHCGACGARVPNGGSCVNGAARCDNDKASVCKSTCVLTTTDQNCGACGKACTNTAHCGSFARTQDLTTAVPTCDFSMAARANGYVSSSPLVYAAGQTCRTICQAQGASCYANAAAPGSHFVQYAQYTCTAGQGIRLVQFGCDMAPAAQATLAGVSGTCDLQELTCACTQ